MAADALIKVAVATARITRSKQQIKNWIMKHLKDHARAYNVNMFFRDCPSCGLS